MTGYLLFMTFCCFFDGIRIFIVHDILLFLEGIRILIVHDILLMLLLEGGASVGCDFVIYEKWNCFLRAESAKILKFATLIQSSRNGPNFESFCIKLIIYILSNVFAS
jgi:hypothetical protein